MENTQTMNKARQKCVLLVKECVPPNQQSTLITDPTAVITTDNNCKMEDYVAAAQKVMANDPMYTGDRGPQDPNKPHTMNNFWCMKIRAAFQDSIVELKVDCFSDRENGALKNLLKTAYNDSKDIWASESGKSIMKEMPSFNQELLKCALGLVEKKHVEKKNMGSGQPSVNMFSMSILQIFSFFLCFWFFFHRKYLIL